MSAQRVRIQPIKHHPSPRPGDGQGSVRRLGAGLALSATLGVLAMGVGSLGWSSSHGMSALTVAIVLGIAFGNSFYPPLAATAGAGVKFSKQSLLRAGVILYGLRVTLHDVGHLGIAGILIDCLMVTSTFGIAVWFGTRILHLDRATSALIGAGSAICGAAAVMATEPVVRAKAEQVSIAVSTVVVFGTLALFLYPAIYTFGHSGSLQFQARAFGIYEGSTIHEVAQVLAAGRSISEPVANIAVITKMVRVMLLAPFLIALSAWYGHNAAKPLAPEAATRRISIPWFGLGFIAMVIFNTSGLLSPQLVGAATSVDTFLLAVAMAALGLTTQVSAIRAAGPKPLLLGAVLFVWLIVGGGAINLLVASA